MLKSTVSPPAPQHKPRSRCWRPLVYPRSALLRKQLVSCSHNPKTNSEPTPAEESSVAVNSWFPLHESVLQATILQLLIMEECVDKSNLQVVVPSDAQTIEDHKSLQQDIEPAMTQDSDSETSYVQDHSQIPRNIQNAIQEMVMNNQHLDLSGSGAGVLSNKTCLLSAQNLVQGMMNRSFAGELQEEEKLLNEPTNHETEAHSFSTGPSTLYHPPRKVSMDGRDMPETTNTPENTTKHTEFLLSKPSGWMDQVVGPLDVCRHVQHDGTAIHLISAPENLPTALEASIATESQLQKVALWQCQRIFHDFFSANTVQSFLRLNDKQPPRPRKRQQRQHEQDQQSGSQHNDPVLKRDWQSMANYLVSVSHALFWREARANTIAAGAKNHNILPRKNSSVRIKNQTSTPTKMHRNLFTLSVAIDRCTHTGVAWKEWFSEHQEMVGWIQHELPQPINPQTKRISSGKQSAKRKRAKTTIKSLEPGTKRFGHLGILSPMDDLHNNGNEAKATQGMGTQKDNPPAPQSGALLDLAKLTPICIHRPANTLGWGVKLLPNESRCVVVACSDNVGPGDSTDSNSACASSCESDNRTEEGEVATPLQRGDIIVQASNGIVVANDFSTIVDLFRNSDRLDLQVLRQPTKASTPKHEG